MLWIKSHRRFQEHLSAYIDGELPEKDALALDAHLESCDACAKELEELRLASAALLELPDVEAPRSFRLFPADVVRPAAAPAVHSVNSGLRLTGAGLAAALAILLVLDTGGLVGGGDEGTRDQGATFFAAGMPESADDKAMGLGETMSRDAASESGSADGFFATEPATPPAGEASAESPLEGAGTSGGMESATGSGEPTGTPFNAGAPPATEPSPVPTEQRFPATGGEGDDAAASPETTTEENALRSSASVTPTPTATPTPSATSADAAAELGLNGFEEQDTETLTAMDSSVDSDDGPSALLVTEIVLAALLGVSIVGVAAATYAERRRR